jgi:hypothetical protein
MEEGDGLQFTDLKKVDDLHQLLLIRYKVVDLAIFLIILDVLLDLVTDSLHLDISLGV